MTWILSYTKGTDEKTHNMNGCQETSDMGIQTLG